VRKVSRFHESPTSFGHRIKRPTTTKRSLENKMARKRRIEDTKIVTVRPLLSASAGSRLNMVTFFSYKASPELRREKNALRLNLKCAAYCRKKTLGRGVFRVNLRRWPASCYVTRRSHCEIISTQLQPFLNPDRSRTFSRIPFATMTCKLVQ
jgi:hypothetical protein